MMIAVQIETEAPPPTRWWDSTGQMYVQCTQRSRCSASAVQDRPPSGACDSQQSLAVCSRNQNANNLGSATTSPAACDVSKPDLIDPNYFAVASNIQMLPVVSVSVTYIAPSATSSVGVARVAARNRG